MIIKNNIIFEGKLRYLFRDNLNISLLLIAVISIVNVFWFIKYWSHIIVIIIIIVVHRIIIIINLFEYLNISFDAILVI